MKLSLFFAALLPILGATTLNDQCDLCPLKIEALKNKIESNKEEIIDKVEKKSDQDSLDKMKSLEQKILESENKADLKITMLMVMREVSDLAKKMEAFEEWTCKNSQISGQISEMKSSILAEVSSGFEKLDKKAAESQDKNLQERNSTTNVEKCDQLSKENASNEEKASSLIRCEKAKLLKLVQLQSGVYFYYQRTRTNCKVAKSFCLENGMDLATFESAVEAKQVGDAAPIRNHYYWVSAAVVGQLPGHFVWSDGRQVDDAFWDNGEPNDFPNGKETCVLFHPPNGKLHDHPCSEIHYYVVCELAKKDQLCL